MSEPTGQSRGSLAIFGGTFDPIHLGHLRAAQEVAEELELATVLFMPCADPVFPKDVRASAQHRLEMARLAVQGNPHFAVSDLEVRRGGKSYAVDTLEEMASRHPGRPLFWLIGADAFFKLHSWYQPRRLFELADFVVMTRPGAPGSDLLSYLTYYLDPAFAPAEGGWVRLPGGHGAKRLTTTLLDISSTDLRRRAAQGLSLTYLVPAAVEDYICRMKLYGAPGGEDS
ncbi:MAG: nicotinate (nicotinamide) nucleotide adenylyltransferase [Desulfarculus sp.]|nr:nicotinate (nicotinamide) nucleotide adenylyltransferase [Desulfarculus sp.]